MSMEGEKPIVEIMFDNFITLCTNQIINYASKFNYMFNNKLDVPIVIRANTSYRIGYRVTES